VVVGFAVVVVVAALVAAVVGAAVDVVGLAVEVEVEVTAVLEQPMLIPTKVRMTAIVISNCSFRTGISLSLTTHVPSIVCQSVLHRITFPFLLV